MPQRAGQKVTPTTLTGPPPDAPGRPRTGTTPAAPDLSNDARQAFGRAPLALETSLPGVLAAGDVRHGSVKRVASAVGEGAIAIQLVHQLLGPQPDAPRLPGPRRPTAATDPATPAAGPGGG